MSQTKRLMLNAAKLLEDEATVAREACEGNGGRLWACSDCDPKTCPAKKTHDRLVDTAKALRVAA